MTIIMMVLISIWVSRVSWTGLWRSAIILSSPKHNYHYHHHHSYLHHQHLIYHQHHYYYYHHRHHPNHHYHHHYHHYHYYLSVYLSNTIFILHRTLCRSLIIKNLISVSTHTIIYIHASPTIHIWSSYILYVYYIRQFRPNILVWLIIVALIFVIELSYLYHLLLSKHIIASKSRVESLEQQQYQNRDDVDNDVHDNDGIRWDD